jgi:hypothetical protein
LASEGLKQRIGKLLQTAHSGGNEHEQQQALKIVTKMLEKCNLSQARGATLNPKP